MPLGISDRIKLVLWPGCGGRAEFSLHTKNVRSVWFVVKRRGVVAILRWRFVDCVIHHERDVREEQQYIYVAQTSNKRDCDAWSLLLFTAAVRSFAHMPLGISDRNYRSAGLSIRHSGFSKGSCPSLPNRDLIKRAIPYFENCSKTWWNKNINKTTSFSISSKDGYQKNKGIPQQLKYMCF